MDLSSEPLTIWGLSPEWKFKQFTPDLWPYKVKLALPSDLRFQILIVLSIDPDANLVKSLGLNANAITKCLCSPKTET